MGTIGLVIAALAGLMIAVIGVLFLARPRAIATTFGLPTLPLENATPWLRLKGIRDLTTGVAAVALLLLAPQRPHGAYMEQQLQSCSPAQSFC